MNEYRRAGSDVEESYGAQLLQLMNWLRHLGLEATRKVDEDEDEDGDGAGDVGYVTPDRESVVFQTDDK